MVRLIVRDRESIQDAVRRFRKLVERSGIKKEMRRREYYEKPETARLMSPAKPKDGQQQGHTNSPDDEAHHRNQ